MYYKKQRKIIIIAAAVFLVVAVLTCVVSFSDKKKENVTETVAEETESEDGYMHYIIIYKSGGEVAYNERFKVSEDKDKIILMVSDSAEVSLTVTPAESRLFAYADIITSQGREIGNTQKEQDGKGYLSFPMAAENIIIHIFYDDAMSETVPEAETEIQKSRYSLEIKGLTETVLETYGGRFRREEFLNSIGDYFKINEKDSEYSKVTTVTFTDEEYPGEYAEGSVMHYVYFNKDKDWRILVTYLKDGTYQFYDCKKEEEIMEKARKESEKQEKEKSEKQTEKDSEKESEYQQQNAEETTAGTPTEDPNDGQVENQTYSFTFNLENISSELVKFVGDKNTFFNKVYDYVYNAGLTGNVTGRIQAFQIKNNKLTFTVDLDSGQTFKGKYNKNKNSYSFSGL